MLGLRPLRLRAEHGGLHLGRVGLDRAAIHRDEVAAGSVHRVVPKLQVPPAILQDKFRSPNRAAWGFSKVVCRLMK
jgi:hypothetical protein